MSASASLAAPQAPAFLPAGQVALPPAGFVDFCGRQPQDCGPDADQVLAGVRQAEADRRALLSPAPFQPATASVGVTTNAVAVTPALTLLPVDEPLAAVVEAAAPPADVAFIDPTTRAVARAPAVPKLTPDLWGKLNRINTRVNAAVRRETDAQAWRREDYWSTPLKDGQAVGDCEDFVLEKRRALLEAGVPASALNIAVVTTTWGETHAVLLVATSKGEFVLDNLSSWVLPWREAPYRWRQRQIGGDAFNWAMAAPEAVPAKRLQVASFNPAG